MNNATTHLADFTEGINKDHIPKYYGEALCNLANSDKSVVALCADVAPPTAVSYTHLTLPTIYSV